MKKLIVVLALLIPLSGFAAPLDLYIYENKNGTVVFTHANHSKAFNCTECHVQKDVKIEMTKDFAHKSCRSCHAVKKVNTACNFCHNR